MFILCALVPLFSIAHAIVEPEVAFVLFRDDAGKATWRILNQSLATTPLSPCSTFKVPHAVFALDAKVISEDNSTQHYDAKQHPANESWPPIWLQSHDLTSAMQHSVVWYFKNIAQAIGAQRMQGYLAQMRYGNQNISGGLTQFWLTSSLRITPIQQVVVWKALFTNQLPFAKADVATVKHSLLLEQHAAYNLYGKTGTCLQANGWWGGWLVGFVEQDQETDYFAVYLQAASFDEVVEQRFPIVKQLLIQYGVIAAEEIPG